MVRLSLRSRSKSCRASRNLRFSCDPFRDSKLTPSSLLEETAVSKYVACTIRPSRVFTVHHGSVMLFRQTVQLHTCRLQPLISAPAKLMSNVATCHLSGLTCFIMSVSDKNAQIALARMPMSTKTQRSTRRDQRYWRGFQLAHMTELALPVHEAVKSWVWPRVY